jgi:nucleoside-diphosphate-sugar epimerase
VRVFLAGASGVIGRRLLPALLTAGHEVTAMTSSPGKVEQLRAAGAESVVADALDAEAVLRAVSGAHPQAVIHELTSIPARINPRKMERDFAQNDRLRTEGTANLVAAAKAAGTERILAQSIAFSYAPGPPGTVHGEQDQLLAPAQAPKPYQRSAGAVIALERSVSEAGGTVLRYGYFYGPGSSISREGSTGQDVAKRRLPIVGDGAGVWSFIHVDDAAAATVAALSAPGTGTYNIVDDEPAPVREWVPALAAALSARAPRKVPALLARLAAGSYGVTIMTRAQGASNELAKRELDWTPLHPSWREGFQSALG